MTRPQCNRTEFLGSYLERVLPKQGGPDFTADDVGEWFMEAMGKVVVATAAIITIAVIISERWG